MSEYQYYEFRAIDRPLSRKEMDELRVLSTRAEITPTSFINTYNYGDFRGNRTELMHRYFDAFVYVSNWGTHRLMFRLPRGLLDTKVAADYCDGEVLSLSAKKDHLVLEFSSDAEPDDEWTQGEEWMPSLISQRADLMRGDHRALYLGWLASLYEFDWDCEGGWDEASLEPPVPAGLGKLSKPLEALADFLRVDGDLIEVAAVGNTGEPRCEPSRDELAKWIKGLPGSQKDDYLVRFLAEEGDLSLRAELSKRYIESSLSKGKRQGPDRERRTVAQLLATRLALDKENQRLEAERAAKTRAHREREQAKERANYLDELANREPATRHEVEKLIATKRPKEYDRAVSLLVDLRDLAKKKSRAEEAETKILELRRRHRSKHSLLDRFDRRNLGK